jgi:hypothetical protein
MADELIFYIPVREHFLDLLKKSTVISNVTNFENRILNEYAFSLFYINDFTSSIKVTDNFFRSFECEHNINRENIASILKNLKFNNKIYSHFFTYLILGK